MNAYIVSLVFAEGGPFYATAIIAPGPEAAIALVSTRFMQTQNEAGQPVTEPLLGVACVPLNAEFLHLALRAVEGKLPENGKAEMLSLVPKKEPDTEEPDTEEPQHERLPRDVLEQRAAEILRQQHVSRGVRCEHGFIRSICPTCIGKPAA